MDTDWHSLCSTDSDHEIFCVWLMCSLQGPAVNMKLDLTYSSYYNKLIKNFNYYHTNMKGIYIYKYITLLYVLYTICLLFLFFFNYIIFL